MNVKTYMQPQSIEMLTRRFIAELDHTDYYQYRNELIKSINRLGSTPYDLDTLELSALFRIGEQLALSLSDTAVGSKKVKARLRNQIRSRFERKYLYRSIERQLSGDKLTRYDLDNLKLLATWRYVYGVSWQGEPFHIDHVKPLSLAQSASEFDNLNRISNLAMLSPTENLGKGSRYPNNIDLLIRINKNAGTSTRWDFIPITIRS